MKTLPHAQKRFLQGSRLLCVWVLCAVLILSACSPNAASQATQLPDPTLAETQPSATHKLVEATPLPKEMTPIPLSSPTPGDDGQMTIEPGLEDLIEQAVADLAQRLDIDPESIQVLEAKSVVWSDGSLGCPQPGMYYTQALQAGALIRLHAQGKDYAYHSGHSRVPFLCELKFKQPYPPPSRMDSTKLAPDTSD